MLLKKIAPHIWHAEQNFKITGILASSRMTIVQLPSGDLWVHSPINCTPELKKEIDQLGQVKYVVAPSKVHYLFAQQFLSYFPEATFYTAPGLKEKRPELPTSSVLNGDNNPWSADLDYLVFQGIPFANETVWFHHATQTLILTDLCQWWQGDISLSAKIFNTLTGVRQQFDVPRTVRLLVKDKAAARKSAEQILQWPIERIIVAHNSIIEQNAKILLEQAFKRF